MNTPNDPFDAIALGLPRPAPAAAPQATVPASAAEQAQQLALQYALAKQVPDMARGFTIATSYGDIAIPPGWMADRIRIHVERVLQVELMAMPKGTA